MRFLLGLAAIPHLASADSVTKVSEPVVTEKRGLQTDTLLHPMDGFTAYTLKQGEFVYNQSPLTLPLPSWAWVGITDWLTAEIDLLPLIGGFFVEPNLPVPSFNFRFRLRDGGARGVSVAFETMVQYLYNPLDQEDGPELRVTREGASWFNRINVSVPVTEKLRVHVSAGATFAENIEVTNNDPDPMTEVGEHHVNELSPDASISIDYRWRPRMSLHATASYGTTFVYSDNQPRKLQAMYGFRVAPFYRSKTAVLRTMRAEFPAFVQYHPESKTGWSWYIPIIPYVYWQWGG